jgi:diguanylate cyclase (GGDEF)-like protein/PAS domain S-box-containing protein
MTKDNNIKTNSVSSGVIAPNPPPAIKTPVRIIVITAILAVSFYVFDLSLPLGVAAGIPYVALVVMGVWFSKTKHIYYLAALASLLTAVGYSFSSEGSIFWVVLLNRILALFAIWTVAFLLVDLRDRSNALKISEKRLSNIMDNVTDTIITFDEHGNIESVNLSGESLFGYTESELVGKNIKVLMNKSDHRKHDISLANYLRTGQGKIVGKGLSEVLGQHKLGSTVPLEMSVSEMHSSEGRKFIGTLRNITERQKAEAQLNYQTSYDDLTGLMNCREFEFRVNRLLPTIGLNNSEHALCFMDLDQFKMINDTCGHVAGDELLRQLGCLLRGVVVDSGTLARLGGDEFCLLIENSTIDQSQRVAELLLIAAREYRFVWKGQIFRVALSIGLVAITDDIQEMTKLLQQANAACWMAKNLGGDRIHVFRPDDSEMALRKGEMQWVAKLNQALDDERFCLYAQPIEGISGNDEMHYEVLLRLLNEEGEIVPPGAFLPAAERYNLIENIDRWVVKNTFELITDNPEFFKKIHFISINLSGKSVTNPKFLEYILSELNRTKIESQQICFEVTETMAISNLDAASTFISILKNVGFSFALDDFGSGLSSFGYLKTLPVDYLKIDGMFVKDIVDDPIDKAMVESINNIGHVMGMKTIAEFVENDQIKTMLIDIGVDYVQGYGIGKPVPFNEVISQFDNLKVIPNE